ncbi:MAG: hypothetical protein H6642_13590 [Caldilineaceae bacterium]|nr:hypothetical protein [Caldilineaceae bacterium]
MKTRFYERTAYRLSDQPVPNCFLKLDDHFDGIFTDGQTAPMNYGLALAESVCARMADVEMYAFLMEDAGKRHSLDKTEIDRAADMKAAVLTRSFVLGYLGACRGLLDSGAVTLATIYRLQLPNSERTFAHANFWHQLVSAAPNVYRRYHPLRLFFSEVFQWCNETAVRVPPVSVLQFQFGEYSRRELMTQLADDRDADLERMATKSYALHWINPLDLDTRWKVKFINLCEKLCRDIEENT